MQTIYLEGPLSLPSQYIEYSFNDSLVASVADQADILATFEDGLLLTLSTIYHNGLCDRSKLALAIQIAVLREHLRRCLRV